MALAQMLLGHVKASLSWVAQAYPSSLARTIGVGCNDPRGRPLAAPIRLDPDGLAPLQSGALQAQQIDLSAPGEVHEQGQTGTELLGLIAQHPNVYVVSCGAVLQAEKARIDFARQKFTRPEVRRIACRSCTRALRSGRVDASHARGLLDYTVDQQALNKIIRRVAQAEARAKA
jgi:hypothetical protein